MSGCKSGISEQGWRDRVIALWRRLVRRPAPLPPGLDAYLDDEIALAVAEDVAPGRLVAVIAQRPDGSIRVLRDDAAIRAVFPKEVRAHG